MKKVFVLGANSNAGSYFVKWCLDNGHSIIASSRSEPNPQWFLAYESAKVSSLKVDINHDLSVLKSHLETYRPNYIVNFASQSMVGESWEAPEDWIRTNVASTFQLIQMLGSFDFIEKYIHFSTPEVYGNVIGEVPEDLVFNPSTPYAATRAAGDFFVKMWAKRYGLPAVITRAGNVYGASQKLYRVIPKSIYYLRNGLKIPLHGGGSTRRNFVHSYDVASAIFLLCRQGRIGETYHIASADYISIRDLVRKICRMLNVDYESNIVITDDRPGKDLDYSLSFKKISELGWMPNISLEDGLNEAIDWHDRNIAHLHAQDTQYIHKR